MNQLLAREAINLSWSILNLAFVGVFIYRIVHMVKEIGFYNDHSNKVTIAFAVYFTGEAMYRVWIAFLLLGFGFDSGYVEGWYPWAFCAAVVALCGGLCVIRLLTHDKIGNWFWFMIFAIVVAVGSTVVYLGIEGDGPR